jgi:hypothetical protein
LEAHLNELEKKGLLPKGKGEERLQTQEYLANYLTLHDIHVSYCKIVYFIQHSLVEAELVRKMLLQFHHIAWLQQVFALFPNDNPYTENILLRF